MNRPYAQSRLASFLRQRVLEMRPKTQIEIATETGFTNPNVLSMIKSGASKLPLDRVPALAAALDVDPRLLLRLALEQEGFKTTAKAIDAIIGTVVTANEVSWLLELRDTSDHTDPTLTRRHRSALRAMFGK